MIDTNIHAGGAVFGNDQIAKVARVMALRVIMAVLLRVGL